MQKSEHTKRILVLTTSGSSKAFSSLSHVIYLHPHPILKGRPFSKTLPLIL